MIYPFGTDSVPVLRGSIIYKIYPTGYGIDMLYS